MKWEDAKMCVLLDRLDLLRRSHDVLEKYEEYLRYLDDNGIHVRDVILKKMRNRPVKWLKNDYPYDIDDACHYLIWSTKPLEPELVRDFADKYTGGREYVTFVNPEHLKSIPDIWHAHVLVRM
ncbi:protein of unknown function (DUF3605) [Paramecium bursaria Chlorella virus NY2B]|uniref:Uncharacterized protein n=1 Tax=Paramecium bursaria Chlorella virus NYs1 TaxID=83442 RepID=M1I3C2_9PHYC|nr:protein of unknown function (DUF3605) [Paramecium bursaria Chlorella virus NYs1]AGE54263.1 protein of unknown function (DUF3605) [Paramecium bursaria Chlorella virus IL-5-2s1]AGE54902.1 protein of unknown function (DUF3605) [Paramecium bursaria Chlorella virus MA1D]AGE58377.1 protein of unknown function (DUF3605) [Paramecium bursaria Chlorella virus NY2B]AGE58762.1 protein of unknown function (DUF3605) [Paramecium bursaria Chlorella virus NYs1]